MERDAILSDRLCCGWLYAGLWDQTVQGGTQLPVRKTRGEDHGRQYQHRRRRLPSTANRCSIRWRRISKVEVAVDRERCPEESSVFENFGSPEILEDARLFRTPDRKSTRLNSSHGYNSYAVFFLKKKNRLHRRPR